MIRSSPVLPLIGGGTTKFQPVFGVVSRMDVEEGELVADFDGRDVIYGFGELDELVLAYATTIHKSQGSEYPAVVIPLSTQH
jgi:exodeoxyribonuclease V alpha subunit